ncbi:MAG TPA: phosphatase PAP2 family protein [Acidimicrobiia bacterium]|nr:phosphatase PAP2 family protein [Acidimicrobiia bacterium]
MTAPPPEFPRSPQPGALWWLAFASGVAVIAAYLFYVRTGVGQRLDDAGFRGRDGVRPDLVTDAESLLGGIEVTMLAIALVVVAAGAFWRGRTTLAVAVVGLVVGSNLTTQLLKLVVLDRPHLIPDAYRLPNSFPSGHATAVASLGIALMLVAPRRVRPALAVIAAATGIAVGLATITAGWHRPGDVIGSWLVVGFWTALVAALVAVRVPSHGLSAPGRGSAESSLWMVTALAIAAYVTASVAWVGLFWADDADSAVQATRHGLALVSGAAGMVGTALVIGAAIIFGAHHFTLAPERLSRH